MSKRRILDGTTTRDGRELELSVSGDEYLIQIDNRELMSSQAHDSEEEMARLALAALGARGEPRCLIGGLGMGFTLRACLDALDPGVGGTVLVAEVSAAVVEWNRGPLAHLASRPLDDPRVRVEVGDVVDRLSPTAAPFDLILLDVDNGPDAMTLKSNRRLYQNRGLERLRRCLSADGVLAIWSAVDDARFRARLRRCGFRVDWWHVPSRPDRPTELHTIFLARADTGVIAATGTTTATASTNGR